jgi:hypothetical protein
MGMLREKYNAVLLSGLRFAAQTGVVVQFYFLRFFAIPWRTLRLRAFAPQSTQRSAAKVAEKTAG